MLLLTDLDGVGAHMDGYLRTVWTTDYPHLQLPEQFTSWSWHSDLSKHHTRAFGEILSRPNFFGLLEPIPGWAEAINKMLDDGHDVHVATSPWVSSETCWQSKVEWVSAVAGRRWRERMVFVGDKTRYYADKIVDDKPQITGKIKPFWQHVIFDQPYNQGVPGPRIHNWTDGSWEDILYAQPAEVQ